LLNPPAEPEAPSWLSDSAPWLVLAAAVAGFAVARPVRVGKLAGRVVSLAGSLAMSPMVRRAALSYAASFGKKFTH
jgi:hypothetical protein